jgi:haloalkane dehalogenase
LRLAAEHPERFARIVVANTGLPNGEQPMAEVWWRFRKAIQTAPKLNIGWFIQGGCRQQMSDEARAGYDAPFPDDEYCAGPRAMTRRSPTTSTAPGRGPCPGWCRPLRTIPRQRPTSWRGPSFR